MSGGRQSAWLSEWGHSSQNAAEISLVCVDWSWSKWQDENQNSVNYYHPWPLGLLFSLNTRKGWRLWWKRKIRKVSGTPLLPRSEIKKIKGSKNVLLYADGTSYMWVNTSAVSTAGFFGNAAVLLAGVYLLRKVNNMEFWKGILSNENDCFQP